MIYVFFRTLFKIMFYSLNRLKVEGIHHIPVEGPVVLCSNHISYLDPPLVGSPLKRKVHYMAKAELFSIPILGWGIGQVGAFPVKRGGVSKESIRHAIQLLKKGNVLGVFPEGTRGTNMAMGKKGAASLALKSGAVVIPVAITGSYKPFKGLRITYGKPIDMSSFSDGTSEAIELATEAIMSSIRLLKEANR